MKRVLSSTAFTVAMFAVAALGALAVLYSWVQPFAAHRWQFGAAGVLLDARLGWVLFPVGLLAASASCLVDAGRRAGRPLHRADWFFVLVGLVVVWSGVAGFFEKGRSVPAVHLVCLAVLAVTARYAWATLLVRLRAGTLGSTIFWPRVFRTLPLTQFSGIFILVVVVIAGLLLLLGAVSSVQTAAQASVWQELALRQWLGDWFTRVALSALTLAVVAVLCRNILAITAAKEAAVEAKLREERFRAELVTNVTHDIRTPLTSIVNYVDLIGSLELDDPTLAEYTAVLGRKAERLKVLIGDLLDASRVSAGTLAVRLEPLELTELIAQVAGDFNEAFIAQQLTWVGPPVGQYLVQADSEHLWRILENLVGNIVKYARPGSCVHADLVRLPGGPPGTIALRLSNLTAEPVFATAEQLTSQFVRGDSARSSEGSGLGLFIADRLARLTGARLAISIEGDRFSATVELSAAAVPVGPAPEWEVLPGLSAVRS
jgi:signal transduction histidine kinase